MIANICSAEKRELMAHPAKIYLASDAWVWYFVVAIAGFKRRKYASSHLVHHYRFSRRVRCQSALACAPVDYVDDRPWHSWLNCRGRSHAHLLAAERWRPLSPGRINRFYSGSDCGALRVAPVQVADPSRIKRGVRGNGCLIWQGCRRHSRLTWSGSILGCNLVRQLPDSA